MLAKLEQSATLLRAADLDREKHVVFILPKATSLDPFRAVLGTDALLATLARRKKKPGELASSPIQADLPRGALGVWIMLDPTKSVFERQTLLRKAIALVLGEKPEHLALALVGTAGQRRAAAELATYVAWVNGVPLPQRRKKAEGTALTRIRLYGHAEAGGYARQHAVAEANLLCRELTVLPPNELTPGAYRKRLARLARESGWRYEEYGMQRLRRMGAGAFVAVAQGSAEDDAAIVHLASRRPGARKTVALVGKGICFDTGGHNLKPARYMQGMHEDMNGSAVALGILLAATRLKLPLNLDCWLAIAQNHLGPRAYKQNDVVTALNGITIEIVHTDAEGRMVLSDTLTLASRGKPDLIVDFATLTGSMHTALGDRYSGIFATSDELARSALAAGAASGERLCAFPFDDDYDSALDSGIADVKQCTMEGGADHILAARLLQRFTDKRPWIHMDLSASSCKGGLGAVGTEATGFGVAWGVEFLSGFA